LIVGGTITIVLPRSS